MPGGRSATPGGRVEAGGGGTPASRSPGAGSPVSLSLRAGAPDFLDLPWDRRLTEWPSACDRIERLPKGLSRHPVEFVNAGGDLFAFKETTPVAAEAEYRLLLELEELGLPAVRAVGRAVARADGDETGLLITRYLHHSLPYSVLFTPGLSRYREPLLDAMAGLLVELHLAGAYWGDCSLPNTLFRKDAGRLQAYLVDAETVEIRSTLSDGLREHDLEIMAANVAGTLADLVAAGTLGAGFPVLGTADSIIGRYRALWEEVNREVLLEPDQRYRIQERIEALRELGFSVAEMELRPSERGDRLRLRVFVTDRNFHRDRLHALTGLEAEETQARHLLNEVHEVRAGLETERGRPVGESVAAYHWLTNLYEPLVGRLREGAGRETASPTELYCELLEHKWYLSERRGSDVGHEAAVADFIARVLREAPTSTG